MRFQWTRPRVRKVSHQRNVCNGWKADTRLSRSGNLSSSNRYAKSSFPGAGRKGCPVMPKERIVAVALLTQGNLDAYGSALKQVFPIHETPCFTELLNAIDEADREHWRAEDRKEALKRLQRDAPNRSK